MLVLITPEIAAFLRDPGQLYIFFIDREYAAKEGLSIVNRTFVSLEVAAPWNV
jgi:hypothetical protein